jgi:STE24 endopeptidase
VDLAVILIFWFSGGFSIVDLFVRSFQFGSIATGLFFIGILLGLKMLISLPFSIYSTFVIEEKFGFNKTTCRLFMIDLIKSIVISAVLGGILLSLILGFLEFGGPHAWLMCWTAGTVFLLIVQYLVPTWIMPLFNTFTPLENGPLKEAIFNYAQSIDFALSNIFVMDGSKRSSKSNAFFTGFGKNKRIVLFDTLIKEQTTEELVSILAHEMGHFKKKHVLKRIGFSIVQMGIVFYLVSIFIAHSGLFHAFFVEEVSIYAGLIFFGMLYSPIDLFISILFQVSSRKDEYAADQFAARTTGDGSALIRALKKLSAHNLSNLTPHPFYVFLNYSHPPVLERIRALNAPLITQG